MDRFELDPLVGEKKGLFGREEVGPKVWFAANLMTHAARDEVSVASAPLPVDLPLPEASGSSCVSGLVLSDVGMKIGSETVGIVPGVLKGLRVGTRISNRREESVRTRNVCIKLSIFLAKRMHFCLANRISKFRTKTKPHIQYFGRLEPFQNNIVHLDI